MHFKIRYKPREPFLCAVKPESGESMKSLLLLTIFSFLLIGQFTPASDILTEVETGETLESFSEPLRATATGFYPIWENTGFVESKTGNAFLGTYSGHVGLAGKVNVGIQPIFFAYRAPNGYIKAQLWESELFSVAGQVGLFHLLTGASRSSFSPMFTTRLDNPDYTVTLLPVSVSATLKLNDLADIHSTITGMGIFGSDDRLKKEAFFAYSLQVELLPKSRHALVFHWTDVGLWHHDLTVLGASYRYRNTWFEGRLGYFYRLRDLGNQNGPLIGFGFLL
jgi:hypothetical protein